MVSTSISAPASLEEAMALLGVLSAEKRHLELRVQALERQLFGPRSEKLNLEDNQLPLLDEVFKNPVPAATTDVVVNDASADPPSDKPERRKSVRRPLPEHLEVVEERLEPASRACGRCGRDQCLVREECTERLDLIPAKLIRRRTVRPVYACGSCKDQSPVQAPMPPQVIEKGLCGPGLLAHVVLSKYLDHRPLYRVQQELGRHGVEVTRSTLADWVSAAARAGSGKVAGGRAEADPDGDGGEPSRVAARELEAGRGLRSSGQKSRSQTAHSATSTKDGNHVLHRTLTNVWKDTFGILKHSRPPRRSDAEVHGSRLGVPRHPCPSVKSVVQKTSGSLGFLPGHPGRFNRGRHRWHGSIPCPSIASCSCVEGYGRKPWSLG